MYRENGNGSVPAYSAFINKLRDNKKTEILVYSLLILAAAIIFVTTGGISCDRGRAVETTQEDASQDAGYDERELEKRLEAILSRIDGVGRVSVMITCERDEPSGDGKRSVTDADKALIGYSMPPERETAQSSKASSVRGVIVVAEGASDIRVRVELQTAVMTVLGVELDAVSVFSMDK